MGSTVNKWFGYLPSSEVAGCGFESGLRPSCVEFACEYSVCFPHSKSMPLRLIEDSQLPIGVNVEFEWLFVHNMSCDWLATGPVCTTPLASLCWDRLQLTCYHSEDKNRLLCISCLMNWYLFFKKKGHVAVNFWAPCVLDFFNGCLLMKNPLSKCVVITY